MPAAQQPLGPSQKGQYQHKREAIIIQEQHSYHPRRGLQSGKLIALASPVIVRAKTPGDL